MPEAGDCDSHVDDGIDSTLLTHKDEQFEEMHAKDGSLPEPREHGLR